MAALRAQPGATVQVLGWDEAFVGVETDDPEAYARMLQLAVLDRTSLHCSVGIGDTLVRAKVATGFGKPRGVYRLTADNWLDVMGDRPTIDLWGVGTKISRRLAALGVTTVRELAAADLAALMAEFGPRMGPWYMALGLPGAMFTASHNPAQYNGIKMCRALRRPARQGHRPVRRTRPGRRGDQPTSERTGEIVERDVLEDYAGYLLALAPVTGRRLKVAVDAGNGMAGHTAPAVLERLDLDLVPMYYELDGTFPNHEANPIEPANLVDLQAKVLATKADIGLAFDGDADRCFIVDERGEIVSPSVLTALIASRELARVPGAAVIHNLITSRSVPELVDRLGGTPVRTRVGHSFIKATMAETDAVFGGEHSGHFYFRDFWRADSGMLAALHVLAALGEQDRPLSELLAEYSRYVATGEINSTVADQAAVVAEIEQTYGALDGVTLDHLDGLTVTHAGLVVQCPRVQHRAPAAAQRRGRGRGHPRAAPRRRARHHQERLMNLDPALLDIVVCPDCRGALAVDETAGELVCTSCGLAYPVRDDIPVLLVDEARRPENRLGPAMAEIFDDSRLDDETALATYDQTLRHLAEAGARVRREAGAAAEAIAAAVAGALGEARPRAVVAAGPDSRLLRAVLEPWCPVPFVAWPGPSLPGWAGGLDLVVVLAPEGSDTGAASAVAEAHPPRLPRRGRLPAALAGRRPRRRPRLHRAALLLGRPARRRRRDAGVPRPARPRPGVRPRVGGPGPRRRGDRLLAVPRPRGQPRQDARHRARRLHPAGVGRVRARRPRRPPRGGVTSAAPAVVRRSPATPSTCSR